MLLSHPVAAHQAHHATLTLLYQVILTCFALSVDHGPAKPAVFHPVGSSNCVSESGCKSGCMMPDKVAGEIYADIGGDGRGNMNEKGATEPPSTQQEKYHW